MSDLKDSDDDKPIRFVLPSIFGSSIQIKIIEFLLRNRLKEERIGKLQWVNFSLVAKKSQVAKSSGKRILDELISNGFIVEKKYETPMQNPPRLIRLVNDNPVMAELLFFFKKVRGLL
jgi:hypothetical protein